MKTFPPLTESYNTNSITNSNIMAMIYIPDDLVAKVLATGEDKQYFVKMAILDRLERTEKMQKALQKIGENTSFYTVTDRRSGGSGVEDVAAVRERKEMRG